MSEQTKKRILKKAAQLVASRGAEGISMRTLAEETGIAASVLYHYFKNKDDLLYQMFRHIGKELGKKRSKLKKANSAKKMLEQRIEFQLDNASDIVAILKYYFANRNDFDKEKAGYIPDRAYKHIIEVLEYGKSTKEFNVYDVVQEAKVITHAINGFVLEYYPARLADKEKRRLVKSINKFILRALTNKGGEKS